VTGSERSGEAGHQQAQSGGQADVGGVTGSERSGEAGHQQAQSIRVLLVDDQPLLLTGFRMILETQPDIDVVGEAGDGSRGLSMARALRPDVVLMDVRMPRMDGIEATRHILATDPAVRVLVLTTFDLDEYVYAAIRVGASGFLLKDVPPADLVSAIRAVAAGDSVMAPPVTRRLIDTFSAHLPGPAVPLAPASAAATLSDREREVVVEVARGQSNAEIAARLSLAEATVKSHVGRILTKLRLRDRVQIAVYAYESGIVTPGSPERS
jgi:DNA-binding NarL/FixJ family response regulator